MKTGRRLVGCVLLLASMALVSGCVSAKYKSAAKSTPAAVSLNLASPEPTATVTVNSVIIYRGPGSWKRDAYWDEYVVTVTNPGTTPLTIESATLTDFTGTASAPSDNPWLLEKQSRTREQQLQAEINNTIIHIGGGYMGLSVATTGAMAAAGWLGAMVALPAYVGGTIYSNIHHRHQIEDEFTRRRLALPLIIAPGQTRHGSLFFRISPGPRHLTLHLHHDDDYRKVAVDLASLSQLHLRAK